jgi:hypothetical protein
MGLERVIWAATENLSANRRGFIWNNLGRLFAQDPPKGKVPQPFVSEDKEKDIRNTYAAELAAKTPEAAIKLLDDALKTSDDSVMRYRLLELARAKAASVYDFSTAFKAADKLDEFYADVNAVGMKLTMVEDGRKGAKAREQMEAVAGAGMDAAVAAVNKGIETKNKSWYDSATKSANGAESDAKKITDKLLEEKANALAKYAKDLSGNGPTGELALAKYNYFILNDDKALDAINKTAEPKLKKLAGLAMMAPKDPAPESYYELGDVAYDAAGEAKIAFEKRSLHEKSFNFYRLALSTATGATKTKFERDKRLNNRIAELEKLTALPSGTLVDALRYCDTEKDSIKGKWKRDGGRLLNPQGFRCSLLQVNYFPGDEYTLQITMVKKDKTQGGLYFGLPLPNGKQIGLEIEGHDLGGPHTRLFVIDGRTSGVPNADYSGSVVKEGVPVTVTCDVRKTGISVTTGGKQVIDWKTTKNYEEASQWVDWGPLKDPQALSIGGYVAPYEILTYRVRTISGTPKSLK